MKVTLYIVIICISVLQLSAQREAYNWYFGNSASITFAPDGAAANSLNDGRLISPEGCASISDSLGNLLFYTNGETVWNKSHQVMVNGTGLNGSSASTQSSIVLPDPRKNKLYYIFTINSLTRTLSYSTADMTLQSGLGEITSKNSSLISPVAEKLTAVMAVNGFDYYVVAHGLGNDRFYSFPVNSSGVSSTPSVSSIGISHISTSTNAKGQMKISPDGNSLAITIPDENKIEIFRFNDGTGRILNQLPIDLGQDTPYGIEFSPDSKRLYVSTGSKLFQFNLEIRNIDDITNSRVEIANSNDMINQLQLAPDGRIYFASNNRSSVGRINNPNENGILSDVQINAVSLIKGNSIKGLPSFVQSYFTFIFTPSIISSCEGEDIQLSCSISRSELSAFFKWTGPNGFMSDEQNPVIQNAEQNAKGYYKVHVTSGSLIFIDSIFVDIESAPVSKIEADGSTTLCYGDTLTLSAIPDSSNYSYLWSTGEKSSSIRVRNAGLYILTTESNGCMSYDSIEITVVPSFTPEIRTQGPAVICEGNTLELSAYPESDVRSYSWSTGDTTQTITITQGGKYTVTIDKGGCVKSASIDIVPLEKPETKIKALGPTSFCTGDSTILTAEPYNPDHSLLWSTGETSKTIVVKQTGIITLETLARNGCTNADTIEISSGDVLMVKINSTNTSFCIGDTVELSASPFSNDYSYLWSTGETGPSIQVHKTGEYHVEVKAPGGCSGTDTLSIVFSAKPSAELEQGTATNICDGDSLKLSPVEIISGYDYKWSTGETSAEIFVKNSGTYKLTVTAPGGCTDSSSFDLTVNPSSNASIKIVQNKVLCNGDSALLIAVTDDEYDLEWSTGETTDSIYVSITGLYTLKAENSFGCETFDSLIVTFNPHPEPQILSDKGFSICSGDSLHLKSSYNYLKYLWSTGDTTESIIVKDIGKYFLMVVDSNGCESTAEAEVKEGENEILASENGSFGQVKILTKSEKSITFQNTGKDTVVISNIAISGNSSVFNLINKPLDVVKLGESDSFTAEVEFIPDDLKYFSDSLLIEIESPCREILFVEISGYGTGEAGIGIPDTSGIIGERNFRIPLRANISVFNSDLLKLSYSCKIKFKADIFLPELVTNGVIKHDTIIAGERILSITDSNVIVSQGVSIITELTGTILLGENRFSPIIIEDFEYDNPLVDFELHNGSIEAIAVCIPDGSIILKEQNYQLAIHPNPVKEQMTIEFKNFPEEDYRLSIFNILGHKIMGKVVHVHDNEKIHYIPVTDFTTGVYIIIINSKQININKLISISE